MARVAFVRDFATVAQGVKGAFDEDRVILNAVQRGFTESRTGSISLPIDSAPLRFRRQVKRRVDAESATRWLSRIGSGRPSPPTSGYRSRPEGLFDDLRSPRSRRVRLRD